VRAGAGVGGVVVWAARVPVPVQHLRVAVHVASHLRNGAVETEQARAALADGLAAAALGDVVHAGDVHTQAHGEEEREQQGPGGGFYWCLWCSFMGFIGVCSVYMGFVFVHMGMISMDGGIGGWGGKGMEGKMERRRERYTQKDKIQKQRDK